MASSSTVHGTEIVTPEGTLPVLAQGQEVVWRLAEALADNIGDDASVYDLPRLTVPGDGTTTWRVPTEEGDITTGALHCAIVDKQKVRAYYKTPYEESGGSPPDCFSSDTKRGTGDPGGLCAVCPFSQFGSKARSKAQACNERMNLLLLTQYSQLPYLLSVPPGSLKPITRYLFALSGKARAYHRCVHMATLEETRNTDGVVYAELRWKYLRDLTAEEVAVAHAFRESLSGLLATVAATVDQAGGDDETSDDDPEGGE